MAIPSNDRTTGAQSDHAALETLVAAEQRLRDAGYNRDFSTVSGGLLLCHSCGTAHRADDLDVDETVRFEGNSDPADEAILLALACSCGERGLFSAAFGPDANAADAQFLRALSQSR